MNLRYLIIAGLGLSLFGVLAEDKPADNTALTTDKQKFGYAQGMEFGMWLNRMEIDADLDALLRGIRDSATSNKTLLTEQEMRDALRDGRAKLQAKREEKRKELAVVNKQKADAFLEDNKKKEGVVATESGLQYKILTEGSGPSPASNSMVTVNYKGTLLDGTEFDSTYKRGQPATFNVSGVIKGWTEALPKMKQGAKWELFIPPNLAYGEMGRPNIPPNSLLIFEVELLTNAPPPMPPAPAAPLTSDIIKVPSLEEMKKGAKIETIKAEDVEKEIKKQQESQAEKK